MTKARLTELEKETREKNVFKGMEEGMKKSLENNEPEGMMTRLFRAHKESFERERVLRIYRTLIILLSLSLLLSAIYITTTFNQ